MLTRVVERDIRFPQLSTSRIPVPYRYFFMSRLYIDDVRTPPRRCRDPTLTDFRVLPRRCRGPTLADVRVLPRLCRDPALTMSRPDLAYVGTLPSRCQAPTSPMSGPCPHDVRAPPRLCRDPTLTMSGPDLAYVGTGLRLRRRPFRQFGPTRAGGAGVFNPLSLSVLWGWPHLSC